MSVHVALMNRSAADVEFVVTSLQSPDGRQASLVPQHILVPVVGSHGTSMLCSPLGKKHNFADGVVEATHSAASVAGRARKIMTRDDLYHETTAVMI